MQFNFRHHKDFSIKNKPVLAPMAGVTDVAFRALCAKYGAGITYTEFVNATAIVRNKILKQLKKNSKEIAGVQIFGNCFQDIAEAVRICSKKFDIIDINLGCPAYKVIKTGAGSEMLKEPEKVRELIKLIVKNTDKPVSVKIRLGISDKSLGIKIAKIAEEEGVWAVTVHGRTQKQGYSGKADWDMIKKIKDNLKIPVIGNGDIFSPEDFKKRLEESGVDAIMIGRGAIGNPYIFKQINDYMKTGKYKQKNKIEMFFEYLKLAEKYKIEFNQIKKQAGYFTKGIAGASKARNEISYCRDINELTRVMKKLK